MQNIINLFLVCFVLIFKACECVHITDTRVPSMVIIKKDVDLEKIVLECDYDLYQDGTSLVVKWYKDNEIMYQWIRGQSPSVFPQFRDDVDQDFKTSSNENHKFSSVALLNPSLETTGHYKCVVQTSGGTAQMEKHLQVVDASNYTLELIHHRIQNETHLECSVDNIYPKPILILNNIDDDEEIFIVSEKVNEDENGLYNATTIAVIGDDDDDIDAYSCTVTFAELPLNFTTTAVSSTGKLWKWSEVLWASMFSTIFVVVNHRL